MSSLIDRISSQRWIHRVVGAAGVYRVAAPIMRRFPVYRRVEPGGLVYRLTSLDQIGVADEMFAKRTYASILELGRIESFIDLGCNAGWFSLYLAATQPGVERRALLVEANPALVKEARWTVERNHLQHHEVVFGAVGLPVGTKTVVFHVSPSASQSSLLDYDANKQLPVKGRIVDLTVPAVSAAEEWRRAFGGRVDLVKLDIEGNELDFVRNEGAFLHAEVRAVLTEYHKWHVTLEQVDAALGELGFERIQLTGETEITGVALYRRSSG